MMNKSQSLWSGSYGYKQQKYIININLQYMLTLLCLLSYLQMINWMMAQQ